MWKTILTNSTYDSEPIEVCILKKQLAKLSCKCSVCERQPDVPYNEDEYNKNDKEIQTEHIVKPIDRVFGENDNKVDVLCKNVSCPGCFFALNLLRTRETTFFKDEETDTKTGLSYCDKSIGKCVKFVEKTTSTSNINKSALKNSNTCVCDKTKIARETSNGIIKKRSIDEHVTFLDYQEMPKQKLQAFYGHCFCLENFIDSIRPPLPN